MTRAILPLLLVGCATPPPRQPPSNQQPITEPIDDPRCELDPLSHQDERGAMYAVSTGDVIKRVLRDHELEFRSCALKTHRGGKVVLALRIDAKGVIAHAEIRGTSTELDRCLCSAVLGIQFEPMGETTVNYPLYFAE